MPRSIAKVDCNQAEIVKALRKLGATVQHIHTIGKGCPDILVGYRSHNLLFEIKAADGMLTTDELKWHRKWRGCVYVVRDAMEAIEILEEL